ncbi:MAG: PTS fructose transporter subunit IIA, partial [Pseudomonadota bacterium]
VEFVGAMEHVVGVQTGVEAICIGADDDMEVRREDIVKAADHVDTGAGVIILTDMFGGTPSNLSISLLKEGHIEVIAGVNLPMLIRLASVRQSMDLASAVSAAQEAGQRYIHVASQLLSAENT